MEGNDRPLAAFVMLAHATFHTYELVVPVFVVAWLAEFSVTEARLGLVLAAGFGLVGVLAPVAGALSDTRGSRALVTASVVGMGAGFLALSAAPTLPLLGGALLLWGAAASLYHPAALSLVSRGAERRGEVLAAHGAAGNVGTAAGPLLAVVLLAVFEWRTVAALLVVPAALAALAGRTLSFEEGAQGPDGGGPAADGAPAALRAWLAESRGLLTVAFGLVVALHAFYGVYYRGVFAFLPDVLAGLPAFAPLTVAGRTVEPAQYAYSGLLTVGILGQYVGGHLSDRGDTRAGLAAGYVALAALTALFVPAADAGAVPLLAVCAALVFLLYGSVPMLQALVADTVPAARHGLTYGYTYLVVFGVGALGAWIAGAALTRAGPPLLFSVLAACAGLGAGVAALIALRHRRRAAG